MEYGILYAFTSAQHGRGRRRLQVGRETSTFSVLTRFESCDSCRPLRQKWRLTLQGHRNSVRSDESLCCRLSAGQYASCAPLCGGVWRCVEAMFGLCIVLCRGRSDAVASTGDIEVRKEFFPSTDCHGRFEPFASQPPSTRRVRLRQTPHQMMSATSSCCRRTGDVGHRRLASGSLCLGRFVEAGEAVAAHEPRDVDQDCDDT